MLSYLSGSIVPEPPCSTSKYFTPALNSDDRSLGVLRPLRRREFQLDAEAVFEGFFELLAQHRRGWAAGDNFAFFFRRFDDSFPFIGRFRGMHRAGEKQSAD